MSRVAAGTAGVGALSGKSRVSAPPAMCASDKTHSYAVVSTCFASRRETGDLEPARAGFTPRRAARLGDRGAVAAS